jgi:hypothetical protein
MLSVLCAGYTWYPSSQSLNRAQHALNGNISFDDLRSKFKEMILQDKLNEAAVMAKYDDEKTKYDEQAGGLGSVDDFAAWLKTGGKHLTIITYVDKALATPSPGSFFVSSLFVLSRDSVKICCPSHN